MLASWPIWKQFTAMYKNWPLNLPSYLIFCPCRELVPSQSWIKYDLLEWGHSVEWQTQVPTINICLNSLQLWCGQICVYYWCHLLAAILNIPPVQQNPWHVMISSIGSTDLHNCASGNSTKCIPHLNYPQAIYNPFTCPKACDNCIRVTSTIHCIKPTQS